MSKCRYLGNMSQTLNNSAENSKSKSGKALLILLLIFFLFRTMSHDWNQLFLQLWYLHYVLGRTEISPFKKHDSIPNCVGLVQVPNTCWKKGEKVKQDTDCVLWDYVIFRHIERLVLQIHKCRDFKIRSCFSWKKKKL